MRTARSLLSLLLMLSLLLALTTASASTCEQQRPGCKVEGRGCVCGTGCASEFRFHTHDECRRALKGRRNRDICSRNPCFNSGACSQSTLDPGYRCRCEGTGFYGDQCQHDCAALTVAVDDQRFPYECVVI